MALGFERRVSFASVWKQIADENTWTKGGEIMGNRGCYVT
jgi:hypothetical protein